MKKFWENYLENNLFFWIFGGIAVVMLVASWIWPPISIIDGSVIAATGEIFGFAALGAVIKAIDKGKKATVTHGQTTLTVGDMEEDESQN